LRHHIFRNSFLLSWNCNANETPEGGRKPKLQRFNFTCRFNQTYTYSTEQSPEKLTVSPLVKKFSNFYEARRFITVFTRTCHCPEIVWYMMNHFTIIPPTTSMSSKWFLPVSVFDAFLIAATSRPPHTETQAGPRCRPTQNNKRVPVCSATILKSTPCSAPPLVSSVLTPTVPDGTIMWTMTSGYGDYTLQTTCSCWTSNYHIQPSPRFKSVLSALVSPFLQHQHLLIVMFIAIYYYYYYYFLHLQVLETVRSTDIFKFDSPTSWNQKLIYLRENLYTTVNKHKYIH
jgi:hypothetical protein